MLFNSIHKVAARLLANITVIDDMYISFAFQFSNSHNLFFSQKLQLNDNSSQMNTHQYNLPTQ